MTPSYSIGSIERVLPTLALDFTTGVLDSRITVSRALNSATRTNSSGVLELVNANLPRFDYNPVTLAPKGLLIEESRTNLFLNSLIDGTNLSTQTVSLTAVAHTMSFYGTGSIAISGGHTATVAGTGNYPVRVSYTFTPTAGNTTFTVTGDVKYAQVEIGSFATSFIPTAGSSSLRNADVVTMTGSNFSSWYGNSEGTFVVSGYSVYSISVANPLIYVTDGTENNYIRILANNLSTSTVVASTISQANFNLGTPVVNSDINDYSLAYKINSFFGAFNSSSGSDTTGILPVVDRLLIGARSSGAIMSGTIKRIYYYSPRLPNNQVLTYSIRSSRGA